MELKEPCGPCMVLCGADTTHGGVIWKREQDNGKATLLLPLMLWWKKLRKEEEGKCSEIDIISYSES